MDKQVLDKQVLDKQILIQKWLDSDIDCCTDDIPIYDNSKYDIDKMHKYYLEDDQDINFDNISLLKIIEQSKKDNCMDEYLSMLDCSVEKYVDSINKSITKVLIKPETKRYHANNLFKRLIDQVENNNFKIDFEDESYDVINVFSKDDFYEFCYNNSVR